MFEFKEYTDIPKVGQIVKKNMSVYLIVGFKPPLNMVAYPLFQCVKQGKNQILEEDVQDFILQHELDLLFQKTIQLPVVVLANAFDENGKCCLPYYTSKCLDANDVKAWYLKNTLINNDLQRDLLFDCTDLVNNRRTKHLEKKQFVSVRKERDKESRFRFFQYKTGTIILYIGNLNFRTFFYLQIADKYKDYILSHKKIYDKYWLDKVIKDGKMLARVYFAKAEMLDTELVLTEKEKKEYFQKVWVQ